MYKLVNIGNAHYLATIIARFPNFTMIEPRIFFINELEEETGNICAVYLRV